LTLHGGLKMSVWVIRGRSGGIKGGK